MSETVEAIRAWADEPGRKSLRRPYDPLLGVFPSRTFNLDPQSATHPHTDQNNLAQGWCSLTPLGDFDPQEGGHLVLWDFGLIIEFPAGSTVLIPSSLITHSNVALQHGEMRYCIVQYASGRLFRWVDNGYQTNIAWHEGASPEQEKVRKEEDAKRWERATESFATLEKLLSTQERALEAGLKLDS
jgi:hypothetical protein